MPIRSLAVAIGLVAAVSLAPAATPARGARPVGHDTGLVAEAVAPAALEVAYGRTTPKRSRVVEVPIAGLVDAETVRIAYDLHAATADLPMTQLATAPDWVVATRLLLGEMGSHRLADAEHAVREAVAILQTVTNRLDPEAWNPDGRARLRPWPGCDDDGTFATCAHPGQYPGLGQPRARAPLRSKVPTERLHRALDTAIVAWWLVENGHVPDVTHGAVSFVHRCGGKAYGAPTTRCDRRPDVPDVAGADPFTGPLVLKGPGAFDPSRRHYGLTETARVDYAPGAPKAPGPWLLADARR